MNVKVISREIIKPSHATPKHLSFLEASLFDHVNSPNLMPMIFFFSPQNNSITTNQTILNQLKGTLPYTLSLFYPLAGRFKDINGIECNDEGVPYVEAQVMNNRVVDVVHKANVSQLDPLIPLDAQEGLLLAIQVTTFHCGGVAITVKINHKISDAFSKSMFVNTWTAIAKDQDHWSHLTRPYFEISKVFPNKMDVQMKPTTLGSVNFINPVTKRFLITKDKLNALRTNLSISYDINTSLVIILSAFIWSRLKIVCWASDKRPCQVFHAINFRPNVKPPEKCYYYGNMVVNAIAEPSMLLASNSPNDTNQLSRNLLHKMKEKIDWIVKDYGLVRDLQTGRKDLRFMKEMSENYRNGKTHVMGFSNIRSLPLYDADFGLGKPVWVTMGSLAFKQMVIFMPNGPSSQDIDAYISLSDEDMAKLESDEEFLLFASPVSASTTSKL